MEYRRLGHSGLQVSALSLGAWVTFGGTLGRTEVRELVACAYDAGINLFDSAENYAHGAAEALLGDVLADLRLQRDSFCVTSKAYFGPVADPRPTQRGLSRKHLRDACDAALRRLRVEYLDLFLCHRPDSDTPVEETVAAMDQLMRAGKVLYWGTSEWPAEMIRAAARIARSHGMAVPATEQAQYNVLHRERVELEYAGLYDELGLGLMTWSPLASGLLSGKYAEGAVPEGSRLARQDHGWRPGMMYSDQRKAREAAVARLVALAAERGVPAATLAIAWCLHNPKVSSTILGCSSVAQLRQNLGALRVAAELDGATRACLDAISP
ncbi:aldo/keto reductase [Xanthomonadaceae bacterium XH05]|nr:aldo/keto reductase [Xanthomonadaceae bacterium XH05]